MVPTRPLVLVLALASAIAAADPDPADAIAAAVPAWDALDLEDELARVRADLDRLARPDPSAELVLQSRRGYLLAGLERHAESLVPLERAVTLARELRDEVRLTENLGNLAISLFHLGELERGLRAGEEALALATERGDVERIATLASNCGSARLRRGEYEQALAVFTRGLEAERGRGDRQSLARLLSNVGVALMELGHFDPALETLGEARALAEPLGASRVLASVLANEGATLHLQGRHGDALGPLERALALRRSLGLERDLALSLRTLGGVQLALGRLEDARAACERAVAIQRRLGLRPELAGTLTTLAAVYAALDDGGRAREAADEGLALAESMALESVRLDTLLQLADLREGEGDARGALAALREARALDARLRADAAHRAVADLRARDTTLRAEQQAALARKDAQIARQRRRALAAWAGAAGLAGLVGWAGFLATRRGRRRLQEVNAALEQATRAALARADELERAVATIRELEEARHRHDKLASIGTLAGGIAHDLNNALAVLVGHVSLMRGREPGPADARLDEMDAALERAAALARRLLSFAEGGDPVCEARDVEPLLREAVARGAQGARTRLVVDAPATLPLVVVDGPQIVTAVAELVRNAVEAAGPGGTVTVGTWAVEPAAAGASARVRVRVVDDGPGIPPDARSRVFDPYFTTREGATGIGLTVAHAIARRHGGELRVAAGGGGARFELDLPAAGRPPAARPPSSRDRRRLRVLVVDDEPLVRRVLERALDGLGHASEPAADGDEALARFAAARERGEPFDLVILDLTLPGGPGGVEILGELRALDPGVRALVASGYASSPVLSRWREAGFAGVLVKPFSVARLERALEAALCGDPPEGAAGPSAGGAPADS